MIKTTSKRIYLFQHPQEESDAYIQEIESIGAAYEDMQGQNTRLLAQLADNDRVNNDLVAERVRVRKLKTPN